MRKMFLLSTFSYFVVFRFHGVKKNLTFAPLKNIVNRSNKKGTKAFFQC